MKRPLVSICIPCNGRIGYVRNTLKSIYNENSEVPLDDYEVVISDNDSQKEIAGLISEFSYSNLHYKYTECEGFMNSYYVLTYGNGLFLKLHNSQVTFREGSLAKLIEEVKNNLKTKPLFFYTNGLLFSKTSKTYHNFNDFMFALSYWPSWSNGFSIWKEDFDVLGTIPINKLFPHTSIFITQHGKSNFLVNDNHWFDTQRVKGRSGHNKFEAFTIEFPSLVDECYNKGWISLHVKKRIFHDIVTEYLPILLFNKYIIRIEQYDIKGYKQYIKRYFPKGSYWLAWLCLIFVPFNLLCRKIKMRK